MARSNAGPSGEPYDRTWLRGAGDRGRRPEQTAELISFRNALLRRMVRRLPDRGRLVIHLRYGFGGPPLSCEEIAQEFGWRASAVDRIEQSALERLRADESTSALRHQLPAGG